MASGATALASAGIALVLKLRAKFRFRGALGLDNGEPVVFVLADRPIAGNGSTASLRNYVTQEDLASMLAVDTAFVRADWSRSAIDVRVASRFGKDDPEDHNKNIVVFCSGKSNPVTLEVMQELTRLALLDWAFVEDAASGQWKLRWRDGSWESPSYGQEALLLTTGRPRGEGPIDDHAILARLPNPWNPAAKVYLVAGIRGEGTRGAGEYFRDNLRQIKSATRGKDFVWLLHVTCENYRVRHVDVVVKDDRGR